LYFQIIPLPPRSTLFPYTTLFRSLILLHTFLFKTIQMGIKSKLIAMNFLQFFVWGAWLITIGNYWFGDKQWDGTQFGAVFGTMGDRKSTRLNSSHVKSSYAVFCLK